MPQRIAPAANLSEATFSLPETTRTGFPVKHLFDTSPRRGTASPWIVSFMSLLVIHLLASWPPPVISSTGMTLEHAALVTVMFQVGGTLGAIALGQLMDRFSPQRVLALG